MNPIPFVIAECFLAILCLLVALVIPSCMWPLKMLAVFGAAFLFYLGYLIARSK